ncbi:hypothetical protein NDU88_000906 [Pleurodeles waltl]|uniref:Uncharacterized protein n=1 Tax=Pleurodeles waltl TaxID=8319 RepID=A0AAV7VYA7_PLEWA|nr:hypothetical protein NDU88_000906 [Pleurodeles waltl]
MPFRVPPEGCIGTRDYGPETAVIPKIVTRLRPAPVSGPARSGCTAPGNLRPGAGDRTPAGPERGVAADTAPLSTLEPAADLRKTILRERRRLGPPCCGAAQPEAGPAGAGPLGPFLF